MSKLLASLVFLVSFGAFADPSAFNGQDRVVLHQALCTDKKVLDNIPKTFQKNFHAADVAIKDDPKATACWTFLSDKYIGLIFSDGDHGLIPMSEFEQKGL